MRSRKNIALCGAALAALLSGGFPAGADQPAAPSTPLWGQPAGKLPRVERGFTRLYDGRHLDGWKMAGPGQFAVLSDGSLASQGGMGLLWYAREKYKDFDLKVDWKAETPSSNSGIFVRFPDPGNDPWVAVNKGYEIQIADNYDPKHRTGSVYTFQESTSVPTKPSGQWNTMEIIAVGPHYTVKINTVIVCEYDGDRSREGYIGLQNHSDADKVWFRNIRVKKL